MSVNLSDQPHFAGGVQSSSEFLDSNFHFEDNPFFNSALLTQFFNELKPTFYRKGGFPIMGRYQLGGIIRESDSLLLQYHPKYQYGGPTITVTLSVTDRESKSIIHLPDIQPDETVTELTIRWLTMAYDSLVEKINRDARFQQNFIDLPSLAALGIGVTETASGEPASLIELSWEA
jgi:hypothetical protein